MWKGNINRFLSSFVKISVIFLFSLTDNVIISNVSRSNKGLILCSSKGLFIHTLAVIKQLNEIMRPRISICVAHCSELDFEHIKLLKKFNVLELDICAPTSYLYQHYNRTDIQLNSNYKPPLHDLVNNFINRTRSYFCKTAALLSSPFDEIMLVDHDVIWFENPNKLWLAPGLRSLLYNYILFLLYLPSFCHLVSI